MVLPVRIELTTSPLPRECSTTELRQQRLRQIHSKSPGSLPHGAVARKRSAPMRQSAGVASHHNHSHASCSLRCAEREPPSRLTEPFEARPIKPRVVPQGKDSGYAQTRQGGEMGSAERAVVGGVAGKSQAAQSASSCARRRNCAGRECRRRCGRSAERTLPTFAAIEAAIRVKEVQPRTGKRARHGVLQRRRIRSITNRLSFRGQRREKGRGRSGVDRRGN